ncbi:hypothetical protein B4U80_13387 [Leptotrombidium deliense]|uniref:CCHC-type domain-containing protein n=1 Tax=Leptotrombidium deliense TaxID=299467 RepID=A0A443S775_9ACAR|nr:hypothetical protein B4U80_13387 [Leptotrombidium deliense]
MFNGNVHTALIEEVVKSSNFRNSYAAPKLETIDTPCAMMSNAGNTTMANVTIAHVIAPRPFTGRSDECIVDWLDHFDMIGNANGWATDDEKFKRLPSYLDGTARKWYFGYVKQLKTPPKDYKELKDAIKEVFGKGANQAISFDALHQRQMLLGESVEDYFFDKLRLCQRYNSSMTDLEKVNILLRGLAPYLLDRIYPLQPKTPSELFKLLRLFSEGAQMANSRTQWNSSAYQQVEQAAIQAERSNFRSRDRGNGRFRQFNRDMRSSLDTIERRNRFQSPRRQSNERSQSRNRNGIRCYNCQKVGHIARECRLRRGNNFRNGRGRSVRWSEN